MNDQLSIAIKAAIERDKVFSSLNIREKEMPSVVQDFKDIIKQLNDLNRDMSNVS